MSDYSLRPIGQVHNQRTDPQLTDFWADVESTIALEQRFGDQALQGLDGFSHVEVIFLFHLTKERADFVTPQHSRGRAELPKVGIFAGRGPNRPNRIGVTTCEIVRVGDRELVVRGLDATDGTPVLDIKPAMREFGRPDVRQPDWVADLMQDYFRSEPQP